MYFVYYHNQNIFLTYSLIDKQTLLFIENVFIKSYYNHINLCKGACFTKEFSSSQFKILITIRAAGQFRNALDTYNILIISGFCWQPNDVSFLVNEIICFTLISNIPMPFKSYYVFASLMSYGAFMFNLSTIVIMCFVSVCLYFAQFFATHLSIICISIICFEPSWPEAHVQSRLFLHFNLCWS